MSVPTIFRNRIVRSGFALPDQLLANPRNARVHPTPQQEAMLAMLKEIGWAGRATLNEPDDLVLDGHMRVMLALRYEETAIPADWLDLSPDEADIYIAARDQIGAMAGVDRAILSETIADVTARTGRARELLATVAAHAGRSQRREIAATEAAPGAPVRFRFGNLAALLPYDLYTDFDDYLSRRGGGIESALRELIERL